MVAVGIFVLIGILACISATFPPEGIALGEDKSLRFPSLEEMLEGDGSAAAASGEASLLSPEEQLQQQEQLTKEIQAEQEFIRYFETNPARIRFPYDSAGLLDITYFDALYTACIHSREQGVRIVHYGDSQLEADRISSELRKRLQDEFGGGGNGILPMQESLWSMTTNIYSAQAAVRYQVYGPATGRREGSNKYGPMGSVSLLDSVYTIQVSPKKQVGGLNTMNYFNQLTVVSSGNVAVRAQGKTAQAAGAGLQMTTLQLKDSTTNLTIHLSGQGDIYGIMLDNQTGVSVDNIPMRSCSGTIFTNIDSQQLRTYFANTHTALIILQFGGNSMPYIKTEKAITNYVEQLRRQVKYVKSLAPESKLMWIGPSDMSTRINGKMQTYPMLHKMDSAIAKMVNDEGCAYWSLYESMGGSGSMVRWANSQPALAGNDYVHFTRLGAQKAGQLLTDAIMMGYRFFLHRHPEVQMVEAAENDSLQAVEPLPTPQQLLTVEPVTAELTITN